MVSSSFLRHYDATKTLLYARPLFCLIGSDGEQVERIQQFGFSSNPPIGTACLVGFIGADRSKPVVIGDNAVEYRPVDGADGSSIQYDSDGQYILIDPESGDITIQTNGLLTIKSADKVRIESDMLECTGEIKDRCDDDGTTMSHMRGVYDGHVHPENDSGGPTDVPNQTMGDGA